MPQLLPSPRFSHPPTRWRRLSHAMSEDASAPLSPQIAAHVLPHEMLHDDEVVLILTKPSLWFIVISSFRFLLAAALLGVLAVKLIQPEINVSPQVIPAVTALICICRIVWAMLVWSSHTYMLTNQRIVTIKGVLNTSMVQAHLKKIQRTVVYRPLIFRLLGIGTVAISTAATTDYDATWVMIARPVQTQEAIVAAINRLL